MLRPTLLAALVSAAIPITALAQSADELKNDEKTPGDVLVYGMGYSGQRYSPLAQINKQNVSKLVPVWAYSLADLQGGESFSIVKDGVIYVTTHNSTAAVDAMTGKQVWRVMHEYPPETLRVVCCGIVNRGAGIYEGMIIRALMDNRMIALDAKTGKEIWSVRSPDPVTHANGYAMTGAPLIVGGVVITGVAGAEFSHRGLLEGYDAKTGKHLWRTYTISRQGRAWLRDMGRRFRAHRRRQQLGDGDLRSGARPRLLGDRQSLAVECARPQGRQSLHQRDFCHSTEDRGTRLVFPDHAQDPFDYDAVQTPVIATINVGGSPRKVVMQANRSGFLYVLDGKDGKLIAGNAYGKVNWASGIDKETGRPIVTDVFKDALAGKNVTVWPSVSGVTNWQHMSFSPQTGILYINTLHIGMTYEAANRPSLCLGVRRGRELSSGRSWSTTRTFADSSRRSIH